MPMDRGWPSLIHGNLSIEDMLIVDRETIQTGKPVRFSEQVEFASLLPAFSILLQARGCP